MFTTNLSVQQILLQRGHHTPATFSACPDGLGMYVTCARFAGDILSPFWGEGSGVPFNKLTTAVAAVVRASLNESCIFHIFLIPSAIYVQSSLTHKYMELV